MARLIDADELPVQKVYAVDEAGFGATFYMIDKTDIDKAPTIEAKPVVHGEWVNSRFSVMNGTYEEQCSCCKGWSAEYNKPYCCNCGADMRKGKKHEKPE